MCDVVLLARVGAGAVRGCVPALMGSLLCGGVAAAAAADWPQFRGPNCSGIAADAHDLPVGVLPRRTSAGPAPVGDGIGGAVVASGRLFVAGMTGEGGGEPVRLRRADGETALEAGLADRRPPRSPRARNSHASSTPPRTPSGSTSTSRRSV